MKMPSVYQIESTNVCNYSCHFCPLYAPWNDREQGYMDPMMVELVDWSGTEYTEVQFGGEPLLHPEIGDIIKRIRAHGVRVGFSTNASKPELLMLLLDAFPDLLVTINDDEYREPLPELAAHPNVHVQRVGGDPSDPATYPLEDYSREKPVGFVPFCVTPRDFLSVQWNGDVVPCCKDHSGKHVLGNLYEESFEEIVLGKRRQEFLRNMLYGAFNGMCEFCQAPNPHKIHEALVKEIPG